MPLVAKLSTHMPRAAAAVIVLLGFVALGVFIVVIVIGGITGQEGRDREARECGGRQSARVVDERRSRQVGCVECQLFGEVGRAQHHLHARQRCHRRDQGSDVCHIRAFARRSEPVLPPQGRPVAACVGRPPSRCSRTDRADDYRRCHHFTARLLPGGDDRLGLQRRGRRLSERSCSACLSPARSQWSPS